MRTMTVSVIIPAFNEAKVIGEVVQGILQIHPDFEVIVINDGSTDDTAKAAASAGAQVFSHPYNIGNGASIKTGIRMAKGEVLVFLDGDGQHDPSAIPDFISAAEREGADVVVGTRMHAVGEMPRLRIWTNRTTSRVVSFLAGREIPDSQSGYRLIRTRVLRDITRSLVTTRYDTESEVLIRAARRGYSTAAVAIESIYTEGGVSHINPVVDTFRFVRLVARALFWR